MSLPLIKEETKEMEETKEGIEDLKVRMEGQKKYFENEDKIKDGPEFVPVKMENDDSDSNDFKDRPHICSYCGKFTPTTPFLRFILSFYPIIQFFIQLLP